MKRHVAPALAIAIIFPAFWAYTIAGTLVRDMGKD